MNIAWGNLVLPEQFLLLAFEEAFDVFEVRYRDKDGDGDRKNHFRQLYGKQR